MALEQKRDSKAARAYTSADIQDVRRRLMTLANLPENALAQKRAVLKNIWGSQKRGLALDEALMGIGDDRLRHSLMEFILREGDVRLDPEDERPVAHLVAVGVLFEGPVPTNDARTLQMMMTESANDRMRLDFEDPDRPGQQAVMVALPLYEWRCLYLAMFDGLFAGQHDRPDYLPAAWEPLVEETTRPCFCYVFSPPISEIDTSGPDWTCSGPVFDQYIAAIKHRIQEVRKSWPQARISLRPAVRFSQAIQPLQEAAVAHAVKEKHQSWREFLIEQGPENGNAGTGGWPTTAIASLTTGETVPTADILLINPDKPGSESSLVLRYEISALTTVESLRRALAKALNPDGLTVVTMPSAPGPANRAAPPASDLYRDIDGRWLPEDLFGYAYAARQLINNDKSAIVMKADSEENLREMYEVPTPVLCQQFDLAKRFREHFRGDIAERVLTLAQEPGLSYTQAHTRLKAEYPALSLLHAERWKSSAPVGLLCDTYLAHHFNKCEGRLFHIRHALIERLDFTDIDEGVPVSYLRAPFSDCYFHLERPQTILPGNPLEDELRLHGFYVTQQTLSARSWRLAISPVVTQGAAVLYARAGETELVLESNDSRGLLKVLNEMRASLNEQLLSVEAHFYQMLNLSAKIMLYLGLRSARLVSHDERTRAQERMESLTPGERKRLARRSGNLYDFIEVGPKKSMQQEQGEVGGTLSARVFWRRGFFRKQAYGPKWSLHRQKWIQPTIVNADLLTKGDELPPVRRYRVGGKTNGRP